MHILLVLSILRFSSLSKISPKTPFQRLLFSPFDSVQARGQKLESELTEAEKIGKAFNDRFAYHEIFFSFSALHGLTMKGLNVQGLFSRFFLDFWSKS